MKRKKKRMASLLVVFVVFAFAVQAYGNVLYFDKGTKYGFSEETESIVEAHMEDFNVHLEASLRSIVEKMSK